MAGSFLQRSDRGHTLVLELRDGSGLKRSQELAFNVTSGPDTGYVRISPRNRQYLEHESGQTFFPIGLNMCMYQVKEGTYYYERLLERLHAAGGNCVRHGRE